MNYQIGQRIMLVEEQYELAEVIRDNLTLENFIVDVRYNSCGVIESIRENEPDLVLLDVALTGVDGLAICKAVREFSVVPIIMLSARVEEIDRLLGLEIAADDYVCRPVTAREVVVRVKAVLRRAQPMRSLKCPSTLQIDIERFTAYVKGNALDLTRAEFHLLKLLSNRPGKVFSRQQIIDSIYNDKRVISNRSVDTHIKNLRRKMYAYLSDDSNPIQSVYGVGYKLESI